jgi:hypothetical protein
MATNALRTYTVRSGTGATNTTGVALTAATAKSVVVVMGSAADTLALIKAKVTFSSATATDAPAIVEIGVITAAGTTTVEPTYNRIIDSQYVPVFNGLYEFWVPLGFEPQVAPSNGFAIRVTSPAAATCLASILYGE